MMAPPRRARTGRGALAPGIFWWAPYGANCDRAKLGLRHTQGHSWGYFQVLLYGDVQMRFRPNSSWGGAASPFALIAPPTTSVESPTGWDTKQPPQTLGEGSAEAVLCMVPSRWGEGTEPRKLTSCRPAN